MANYFLHVKIFSRGKGSNAIKAAAYRAGERIRDDGTSVVYNYLRREDVAHAEIVLPAGYAGSAENIGDLASTGRRYTRFQNVRRGPPT